MRQDYYVLVFCSEVRLKVLIFGPPLMAKDDCFKLSGVAICWEIEA
jgi:hypothetical protein